MLDDKEAAPEAKKMTIAHLMVLLRFSLLCTPLGIVFIIMREEKRDRQSIRLFYVIGMFRSCSRFPRETPSVTTFIDISIPTHVLLVRAIKCTSK